MRTEWKLFTGLGIFMLPLGVAYAIVGHFSSGVEIAGTIMLLVVAVAFAFIGVYLGLQSHRMDGLRPEDYDADVSEGQGEVGSFPVSSIWPLVGATGATLAAYGLIFTSFFLVPAFALIFATVIGMARESEISELGHFDFNHSATPGHTAAPDFSDNVKKQVE